MAGFTAVLIGDSRGQEKVLGSLRCDVHPQKGRILVAEKNFACGTKHLGTGKSMRYPINDNWIYIKE